MGDDGALELERLEEALVGLCQASWTERERAVGVVARYLAAVTGPKLRPRLKEALLKAADDEKWEVRRAVATALGDPRLRGLAGVAERLQVLTSDVNGWVREAAAASLGRGTAQSQARSPDLDALQSDLFERVERLGRRSLSPRAVYDLVQEVGERHYRQLGADMAHELRTMLTPMLGFVGALREHLDHSAKSDERTNHLLERLADQGHLLLRLVQDLQEYTRQEGARLDRVELAPLLAEVVDHALERAGDRRPALGEIKVDLDLAPGVTVEGHSLRLRRAFLNLVSNALLALGEGGTLTVRLRVSAPEEVTMVIRDTGVGMTEEQLELAVVRFSTTRRDRGGTGLGLPITKRIVEEVHGGRFTLESKLGQGTTATVVLPTRWRGE